MSAGGIFDRLTRAIDGLLRNNELARRESEASRRNNDQIARLLQRQDANEPRLHEGPTLVQESEDKLKRARDGLARAQHAFNVAQHSGQGVGAARKKLKRAKRRVVHAEAGVLRSEAALTGAQLSSQQAAEEEQRVREQQAQEQRQAAERQARERSPNFATAAARMATRGLGGLNQAMANPQATIRAGQAAGGAGGTALQGVGGLLAGMQGQGPAGGAVEFLHGAGNLLTLVPGVGQAAGAFLKLAGTVVETIDRIRGMARAAYEANKVLADFSPAMAAVVARQDMREFVLNMQKGDAQAKTAENLAQGMNRLDRAAAPWEVAWNNAWGEVKGTLADYTGAILENLTKIAQYAKIIPEIGQGTLPRIQQDLVDMGKDYNKWYEDYGKDRRFFETGRR